MGRSTVILVGRHRARDISVGLEFVQFSSVELDMGVCEGLLETIRLLKTSEEKASYFRFFHSMKTTQSPRVNNFIGGVSFLRALGAEQPLEGRST